MAGREVYEIPDQINPTLFEGALAGKDEVHADCKVLLETFAILIDAALQSVGVNKVPGPTDCRWEE